MKRLRLAPSLALALLAALWVGAATAGPVKAVALAAGAGGHFVQTGVIDWKNVLPAPPAAGSIAARGDLETVLQVQAARTAADIAWAKLIEKENVYADFADIIGPWFSEENLPVTAGFLKEVTAEAFAASKEVKSLYARSRPPAVEPAVQPCVAIPATSSYPSGHSIRAFVWAAVLGEIFADKQTELFARAHHVAWGRIIGGVHFPSDDVGGQIVARAVVLELRKNPEYRAAIEKCRAEAEPFLLKKAA